MSLTFRQAEMLRFIDRYQRDNRGVSPSYQEMSDFMGISAKSGVARIIDALVERGFITRIKHRHRSIEILKMPDDREVAPPIKSTALQSGNRCPHCDGVISIPFRGTIS